MLYDVNIVLGSSPLGGRRGRQTKGFESDSGKNIVWSQYIERENVGEEIINNFRNKKIIIKHYSTFSDVFIIEIYKQDNVIELAIR